MEIRAKTVLLLLYERQMMCGSPNAATLLQKWSEEKNTSQHQLTDCKKCKNIQSLLLTKPGMKKS